MRADYDSRADTLAIHLRDVDRLDWGDDSVHPQTVVGIADDTPAIVDGIGAGHDVEGPLAAVAARYALDRRALTAAARSALAAPDRVVPGYASP